MESAQPESRPPVRAQPGRGERRLLLVLLASLVALAVVVAAIAVLAFSLIQTREFNLRLRETGSQYRFEDPDYLFHSTFGQYYLAIDLTVTNEGAGSGPLAAAEIRLNSSLGLHDHPAMRPSSYLVVAPGQEVTVAVVFAVNATDAGYRLEYKAQSIPIPVPPPPPPEFAMHVDNVTANPRDSNGFPADPGRIFQWVNLSFVNHWHNDLEMDVFYFLLDDTESGQYDGRTRSGPDAIPPGGSAQVTVIWDTPASAVPARVTFHQFLGPWGSVDIP